jgi:NAD(P)-dependent dehydrogenase (short-subunit alcohol dehydrogenase family)
MGIALITGASRGLGRNMALRVAERGHDVIITYNSNKDEADKVADQIGSKGQKAAVLQLDVSDSGTFSAFAESFREALAGMGEEKFDWLVNNAGMGVNAPFTETTEEQFDLMVNTHLKAPFFLTQRLLPLMNDGGRIVNITSGLARFSLPGSSAYGSAKAGLDTLTRYMARELGDRGISVISFAPGAIETDFGGGVVRDNKDVNKMIASGTALGRVGLPEDIGGAVAALLSDECRWINGQRIEASGGIFL